MKMTTLTTDQAVHLQRAAEWLDGAMIWRYQPTEEYHTCIAIEAAMGVEYVLLHLLRAVPDDVADAFATVDAFDTAVVRRDGNVAYFPNITTDYDPDDDANRLARYQADRIKSEATISTKYRGAN